MSKQELILKAQTRKERGKKRNAELRKQGNIPAIIYGHKQDPLSVTVNEHDFMEVLHHGKRLMDIEVDGKGEKLLLKELQYDHLGKKVIHIDLIRVDLSEKVTVQVPLVFKGNAVGVAEGGVVEEHLAKLEVECLVTEIPDSIDVNIKALKIGDFMSVKDIVLPSNLKLVSDPELLVIACKEPVEIVEPTAEGATLEPASPEVITERKPKEGEEGEEGAAEKK